MKRELLSPPDFPNSKASPFEITSPSSGVYNCIAWALERTDEFFWPRRMRGFYWPHSIPLKETLAAFQKLFEEAGYEICQHGELESGFQKVAIFAENDRPTHAARQLANGFWTSKIGAWVDVQHTLQAMEGGFYGDVAMFLKRKI